MEFAELNPYVRHIGRVNNDKNYEKPLLAYDHRLFYVHKGNITVEFSDKTVYLQEKTLLIFPPAEPYRLLFQAVAEYTIINFDFDCSCAGSKSRAPDPENKFCWDGIFSRESVYPFDRMLWIPQCGFADELLKQLQLQNAVQDPMAPAICSGLLKIIIAKAAQLSLADSRPPLHPLIEDVKAYIQEHYTEDLTNGRIAEKFGYHPYYLGTLFLQNTGITLHAFLTQTRLRQAMELLSDRTLSICQIAEQCGYSKGAYFSEAFLRYTGTTPSDYRKIGR